MVAGPCYCWSVCLHYACGCTWTGRTVHRCDTLGTNCNPWTTCRVTERNCLDCHDTNALGRQDAGSNKMKRERVMNAEALGAVSEAEALEDAARTEAKTESPVRVRNHNPRARRRAGEPGEGSMDRWRWEGSGARRRA
ncbi:hypothetical protein VTJ83DRAFT_4815 [Remersonia thermophila]|uniref:Uncharacterized protein n=1 Tax=Remersonia thermophila TaxID=72144 RepID=A0ABR4DB26_9PEZI